MKHLNRFMLLAAFAGAMLAGCGDDPDGIVEGTPIAPIIKYVSYPDENIIVPGKEATITGTGFSEGDIVRLEGDSDSFTVEVTKVTNEGLTFIVPVTAGGAYTVTVGRAGKTTALPGEITIPYVVPLEGVILPTGAQAPGSTVPILGEGFQAGDQVQLLAAHYPAGMTYTASATLTADGITFVVPTGVYGTNTVVITRGVRKSNVGTIGVSVTVGTSIGGGIVYYTENSGVTGLIVAKANVGGPTEIWGPEVAPADAVGTVQGMWKGKENTAKAVAKMASLRTGNPAWDVWQNGAKMACELCDQFTVTEGSYTYTDWFLPSQEELKALFAQKAMMETQGSPIPANNYWTSSEGVGEAGWSAYYVNFYEPAGAPVVTAIASKSGWKLGVRAIRSF